MAGLQENEGEIQRNFYLQNNKKIAGVLDINTSVIWRLYAQKIRFVKGFLLPGPLAPAGMVYYNARD